MIIVVEYVCVLILILYINILIKKKIKFNDAN